MKKAKEDIVKKYRNRTNPYTVHLLGFQSTTMRAALCGRTEGSAWPGKPEDVSFLVDKWCKNCLKRYQTDTGQMKLDMV
jgi:hypothetical protein